VIRASEPRTTVAYNNVVLAGGGGGVEDMHGDLMEKAWLERTRPRPPAMQLSDRDTSLLEQFATSGLLGCLSQLDMSARQAPLVG